MNRYRKTLLIDLDGVLNEYGKEKFDENYIPNIRDGAIEFVRNLNKEYDLYLFTTRNLLLSAKWLINNNLDMYFKDITNIKHPAHLHLDDRAICFNGDYKKAIFDINNFNVYWQN